jgi:hypothetical protein
MRATTHVLQLVEDEVVDGDHQQHQGEAPGANVADGNGEVEEEVLQGE